MSKHAQQQHFEKQSKHHNKLLVVGWVFAVAAVIFIIWQRTQFPHESFTVRNVHYPIRDYMRQEVQKEPVKRAQPKMPATQTTQKNQ